MSYLKCTALLPAICLFRKHALPLPRSKHLPPSLSGVKTLQLEEMTNTHFSNDYIVIKLLCIRFFKKTISYIKHFR